MSDNGIVWEDPPNPDYGGGRKGHWFALLEPLTQRPGVWARVREYPKAQNARSAAKNLRQGLLKMPAGRFEFAARQTTEGGGALYARFMGEDA